MNSGLNLNINLNGRRPPAPFATKLTRENLILWIEQSGLDDGTRKGLLKVLAEHPGNSLKHFYENLQTHVTRVQEEVLKKSQDLLE